MTRRSFLSHSAALSVAGPLGTKAAAQANQAMPMGLNTYSLRALRWNDRQLLEYAASLKLDAVFLQDSLDPDTSKSSHWTEVRAMSRDLGLHLETGGGGVFVKSPDNFDGAVENLRYQITRAKAMGSPVVRINISAGRTSLPPGPPEETLAKVVRIFKAVRPHVLDSGLKLALEVHKDFQAWEFRSLVEEAGPDFVGIYMDTGNPVFVLEHPLTTLETLAPYVVTLHLRDSVVYEHKRGVAVQWVPLGEGSVNLPEYMAKARALCPKVYVYIKPITGRPPEILPWLEPDFWKLFPKARASEFARFLALARQGSPYEGHVVIEDLQGRTIPPHFVDAIRFQQKEHMERSIEYAKTKLDLGHRCGAPESRPALMLRTVTATRYVTPLREGGSLPAIIEADDLGLYVAKFRGAGQGALALAAEIIAGELGRAVGLTVPELVFADIDPALGRNEPDSEIRELLNRSTGQNLAMDYLPGSMMFDPAARDTADEDTASLAVWFDAFVTNVDRTASNPNLLWWHRKLYFIDHGAALYFHHNWPADGLESKAVDAFPAVRHHVLLPWATRIAQTGSRMRSVLTTELLARTLAEVPDAWLVAEPTVESPDARRAAYVRFLELRLRSSEVFEQEAIRARTDLV